MTFVLLHKTECLSCTCCAVNYPHSCWWLFLQQYGWHAYVTEMFAFYPVITEDCNVFLFLRVNGMENFFVFLKQISMWFSLVPLILKKWLWNAISLCCTLISFCLVFTFDIRCPVKMNVNQLHGNASLAKVIPTYYGNCRYMTVRRSPAALINKLCESIWWLWTL